MRIFTILSLSTIVLFANSITAQTSTDLMITQYVEGMQNNKGIELYNGTGNTIDLAQYSLRLEHDGAGGFVTTLPLSGTLENGRCFTAVHSSAKASIKANANITNNTVLNFNGNDAVALFKGEELIDVVGYAGKNEWWGEDITLIRKPFIITPSISYNPNQWRTIKVINYSDDDLFANFGIHSLINPSAPFIDAASALIFSNTECGTQQRATVVIEGINLTSDVTIGTLTTPFATDRTTITKEELMQEGGFGLEIVFSPIQGGIHTAKLTISGGGTTSPLEITISGKGTGEFGTDDFDMSAPVTTLTQTFENATLNNDFEETLWLNMALKGDAYWSVKGTSANKYIEISAVKGSTDVNDFWVVTPAIDFDKLESGTKLRFDQAFVNTNENTSFNVYYIRINNGDVEKTVLTPSKRQATANSWARGIDLPIAGIRGAGFIGFNYHKASGNSSTVKIRIDNISLSVPVSTSVKEPERLTDTISVEGGLLVVTTTRAGSKIDVFNITGSQVASKVAEPGRNTLQLTKGQIYIVKVGNTIKKIIL